MGTRVPQFGNVCLKHTESGNPTHVFYSHKAGSYEHPRATHVTGTRQMTISKSKEKAIWQRNGLHYTKISPRGATSLREGGGWEGWGVMGARNTDIWKPLYSRKPTLQS